MALIFFLFKFKEIQLVRKVLEDDDLFRADPKFENVMRKLHLLVLDKAVTGSKRLNVESFIRDSDEDCQSISKRKRLNDELE